MFVFVCVCCLDQKTVQGLKLSLPSVGRTRRLHPWHPNVCVCACEAHVLSVIHCASGMVPTQWTRDICNITHAHPRAPESLLCTLPDLRICVIEVDLYICAILSFFHSIHSCVVGSSVCSLIRLYIRAFSKCMWLCVLMRCWLKSGLILCVSV